MKRIQTWRWFLAALLLAAVWLTGTAQAWRPSGWTYWDFPWAYDSGSGDWYWFTSSDTQWIHGNPPDSCGYAFGFRACCTSPGQP